MKGLPFLFAVLLTIALTGCTTYQAKDLNAAASQAQLENRTLRDGGLEKFLAANGQPAGAETWGLARLTLAAFYFNPELDVARAQLAGAEAGMRTAEARPNPSLSFTPAYNKDSAAGITPWILGYALDVPYELGGKRTYRTAEAKHRGEAARLEVARIAWSTRSAVRRALAELHAAEATAELWRNQKPLLAQASQLVDVQVQAGEVSPLEAAQARVALNRAELAARESERGVALARSRLAEAVGVPLTALQDVSLSYQELVGTGDLVSTSEARTWAARNRPDLLAALSVYAASESALQGEIARQYPDLTFGPGYELDQGEGKWSLGIGVTLPAFHQNQGPIAAAKARREVEAARFLTLQNRVLAEVDRAAANHQSSLADVATLNAMRANLEKQTATVRAQQAIGETSRLELVRTQIELADTARAELEARLRLQQATGAFEDAVQRPLAWPESVWLSSPRSAAH